MKKTRKYTIVKTSKGTNPETKTNTMNKSTLKNYIRLTYAKGDTVKASQIVADRDADTTRGGYYHTTIRGKRIVWSAWMDNPSDVRDMVPCDAVDAGYIRVEHYSREDDGRMLKIS